MSKIVIDRFEGDFAVCELESGDMVDIAVERLPAGAVENSVLVENNGVLTLDLQDAERRKARIRELEDQLFG